MTEVGRFAPSPTGPLHFGSLVAAVGSWLFARRQDGRWIVRMEDLDVSRVVAGSDEAILETLGRYGLQPDEEVFFQSSRNAFYEAALEKLDRSHLTYRCACSRADLQRTASAPVGREPVYPGTCRDGIAGARSARAVRFRVAPGVVAFQDQVRGVVVEDVATETGDFVVKRADGVFAYQLAVVVDDAAQGVTQVVRGGDLLSSTARQIALQHALDLPQPGYAHLPLIVNGDGSKLGKRDGALPLPTLDSHRIGRTLAAALSVLGVSTAGSSEPVSMLAEALQRFDPTRIPAGPIPHGDLGLD